MEPAVGLYTNTPDRHFVIDRFAAEDTEEANADSVLTARYSVLTFSRCVLQPQCMKVEQWSEHSPIAYATGRRDLVNTQSGMDHTRRFRLLIRDMDENRTQPWQKTSSSMYL